MALRKRLITVLTLNEGVLFRTRNFRPDYRYTINFVDAWSIDEIVMLDVTRPGGRLDDVFLASIGQFAERCFVPLTVGGGIRSIQDMRKVLESGADKIVLNTQAVLDPPLITAGAKAFGTQCIVVSVDARRSAAGSYEVFIRDGSEATGLDPAAWAQEAERRGAGEIMLTSIDRDGTLEGYDNDLNAHVARSIKIPLLVAGGAGEWRHLEDGIRSGGASGVCTANIYHFTEKSIRSAKKFLDDAGLPVRRDE